MAESGNRIEADMLLASISEEDRPRLIEVLTRKSDPETFRKQLLELLSSDSEGSEAEVEEKTPEFKKEEKEEGWR